MRHTIHRARYVESIVIAQLADKAMVLSSFSLSPMTVLIRRSNAGPASPDTRI